MTIAAGQDRVEYFLIASLNTVSPKLVFDKSIYASLMGICWQLFLAGSRFRSEHFKDSEVNHPTRKLFLKWNAYFCLV